MQITECAAPMLCITRQLRKYSKEGNISNRTQLSGMLTSQPKSKIGLKRAYTVPTSAVPLTGSLPVWCQLRCKTNNDSEFRQGSSIPKAALSPFQPQDSPVCI